MKEYKQRVNEMKKRMPNLKVWQNDEYNKYVSQYTSKTTSESSSKVVARRQTKSQVTVNTKYLVSKTA